MNLQSLCDLIELPLEVKTRVLVDAHSPQQAQAEAFGALLLSRATWGDAIDAVAKTLGDDPDGSKMLTFLLRQAVRTHKAYVTKGLDDSIFAATMKFCTRCVVDHERQHGTYAFLAGGWFPRQLSLLLLRVGELEYEMVEKGGDRWISIHIPSDAKLKAENLKHSYEQARKLIARTHPLFADARMTCDSWLLSPVLRDLLPKHSNIIRFQDGFEIVEFDGSDRSALRWVFGSDDIPAIALPAITSLQRGIRALLLTGGNVGAATGNLKSDHPW